MIRPVLLLLLSVHSLDAFDTASLKGYCANVDSSYQASRKPPPLSSNDAKKVHSLVHVQTVIRHGARAPAADRAKDANMAEAIKWDCGFTAGVGLTEPTNLYQLKYDARPTSNILKGTCEVGQLLQKGKDQHTKNGKYVYDAYFTGSLAVADLTASKEKDLSDIVYVRSTDKSRTKNSAATFLDAMIPADMTSKVTSLPIHITDYARETLTPNEKGFCPEVTKAAHAAEESAEFQQMVADNKSRKEEIRSAFGRGNNIDAIWPVGVLDMLKCHICEGKEEQLPIGIRPKVKAATDTVVAEALQVVDEEEIFKFHYNKGEYSKKAMTRLVTDMQSFFLNSRSSKETKPKKWVQEQEAVFKSHMDELKINNNKKSPKFVLWSAHDTTVMPLLGALEIFQEKDGSFIYTPYATVLVFEYYLSKDKDDYLLRIIHNGEDITSRLEGCTGALCSVENLFKKGSSFATPTHFKQSCQPVDSMEDPGTASLFSGWGAFGASAVVAAYNFQ